jgi:multiple sugar transport system substrate-binding protein
MTGLKGGARKQYFRAIPGIENKTCDMDPLEEIMLKAKFLYVLALVVLLGGLFAACAPAPTEEAPAAEAPAAEAPAEEAPAEEAPAEEAPAAPQSDVELVFVWHSGGLAEQFERIAQEYTQQTGVAVRADLVPYGPQWHDKIAAEFAARGAGFDLAMFDSQSMSEFASGNHVVLLNDYIANSDLISVEDFAAAAVTQYGEYPEGSGNIYALPVNQDCMGLAYRKDLFEDPEEMAAFKEQYGYDLAVPTTYDHLRDIAEFFTRPEENLWGMAAYGSRDYDAVTSPLDGVMWSFGAELWDPATKKAEGVINSDVAVEALQFYVDLFQYMPPGASAWFSDEVNNAVHTGIAAMAINWYYYFFVHADPEINPYADVMGYASLPGQTGPDGEFRQYASVGGQGLSISAYSKNIDEAWKLLEWFMTTDVQWEWVEAGAQTGRLDVLEDPRYTTTKPWNATFPESMKHVKDYWHLIEYPQLLDIWQRYANLAVSGEMSAEEALDATAAEQQPILDAIQ